MSLDVYLQVKDVVVYKEDFDICIRENGRTRKISRQEWNERFPDRQPFVVPQDDDHYTNTVFSANITHNLGNMADEAGIYMHLWRPDEIGIKTASELIEPLRNGLKLLKSDKDRFSEFNPKNRWGDYDGLVEFVQEYLQACEKYPDAEVSVWR